MNERYEKLATFLLPIPVGPQTSAASLVNGHLGGAPTLNEMCFNKEKDQERARMQASGNSNGLNRRVEVEKNQFVVSLLPLPSPEQHPQHPNSGVATAEAVGLGDTVVQPGEIPQLRGVIQHAHDVVLTIRRKGVRVITRQKRDRDLEVKDKGQGAEEGADVVGRVVSDYFRETQPPQVEVLGVTQRIITFTDPCDFGFQAPQTQSSSKPSAPEGEALKEEHTQAATSRGRVLQRDTCALQPGFYVHPYNPKTVPYYFNSAEDLPQGTTKKGSLLADRSTIRQFTRSKGQIRSLDVNNGPTAKVTIPNEPPEVFTEFRRICLLPNERKAVETLLLQQKLWPVVDLQTAMGKAGCARSDVNRRIIWVYTYSLCKGAFSRLRLRFGFNPHEDPAAALFQRVAVTMPEGSSTWLTKLYHSGYHAKLVPVVKSLPGLASQDGKKKEKSRGGEDREVVDRSTCLSPLFADLISKQVTKRLTFSLNEVHVHPDIAQILSSGKLAKCHPTEVRGWFTQTSYTKVAKMVSTLFGAWIEEEVRPRLNELLQREGLAPSAELSGGGGAGDQGPGSPLNGAPPPLHDAEETAFLEEVVAANARDDTSSSEEDDNFFGSASQPGLGFGGQQQPGSSFDATGDWGEEELDGVDDEFQL